ncbi:hypothetical protein P280DRAFT_537189 [Massarina eburnea CBS 473.64]|uniref:Ubiquitin 3 binding protein But2 C-terminal domain-containing protein n=1 Tax=Massarina eburnea CBS 473.64 TaxID=1395130 RepID=A0A6A6RI21_9PLEO|nr:hypothetical protein P280DRAFT_537189 [Massarina eburnea CBS 473.64]
MLHRILTTFVLLVPNALAAPYSYPNETFTGETTQNGTLPNSTSLYTATGPTATATTFPPRPSGPPCLNTFYPSELRILNSRYALYNQTELHTRTNMFMALRQREDTFQVATQVQFNDVVAPNWTGCHLKFDIPGDSFQTYSGPQPILYVYQVTREAGSVANWDTYEPAIVSANDLVVYGTVDGASVQQKGITEHYQGYYDIGSGPCNQTMTFQVGLAFDGGDEVNYWQFIDTQPPLSPVHGFKLWSGDNWCIGQ